MCTHLGACMPAFPPVHGAVPAHTRPRLMLTRCLSFRVGCMVSRSPTGLGLSSCLCFCLQGATLPPPALAACPSPKASLRGLPLVVLGWARCPPAREVCTMAAAVTAVGWSIPFLQTPRHIWAAASRLCHGQHWLRTPVLLHVPLASPYSWFAPSCRQVCAALPCPCPPGPAWLPPPCPTHGQAVPPAPAAGGASHAGLH